MPIEDNTATSLPDVAHDAQPYLDGMLDWVGMNNVQMPILVNGSDGTPERISARVDAHVNLGRPDMRGIHMSRLYLALEDTLESGILTPCLLRTLLRGFLASHEGLSQRARVRIRFERLVRRHALKSGHSGWRAYPICISAHMDHTDFRVELATEVVYSSTCPASAALSRQLIQKQFGDDFAPGSTLDRAAVMKWLGTERGMVATPHAQRSVASLRVRVGASFNFDPMGLANRVERALGTPVQTAVKREDEQAFALANGSNLLFCEDAARRIQRALLADENITDFAVRVRHEESLHPHDAVAYASKGVPGGYDPFNVFD